MQDRYNEHVKITHALTIKLLFHHVKELQFNVRISKADVKKKKWKLNLMRILKSSLVQYRKNLITNKFQPIKYASSVSIRELDEH